MPGKKQTFAPGSRHADAHDSSPPSGRCSSDSLPPMADSSGSDNEPCEEDAEAFANWKSRKQRQVSPGTPSAEILAEAAEYVAAALAPPPLLPPAESPSPAGEPQAEPGRASDLSMMD